MKKTKTKKVSKPKKEKKVVPKKLSTTGDFKLTIAVNGETFEAKTNDIAEALLALDIPKIVTKLVITVQRGDKVTSRFFMGLKARMLLRNPLTAQLFAKTINLAL